MKNLNRRGDTSVIACCCKTFYPPKPFSKDTERHFLRDYSERHADCRQMAVIVGLCLCLAYFGLDIFNAIDDSKFKAVFINKILPLRLLGTAALTASIWLTFNPLIKTNECYANFCGTCCVLSTYLMLLALTYARPFPEHYLYYYDGMLLVFLYLCGISRILAKPALLLMGFMLLLTFLTFIADESSVTLVNLEAINDTEHDAPMSFLVIFSMIGYFIVLEQERSARYTFMREQDLLQAREEIKSSAEAILLLKEQARLHAEQQNCNKSKFIADAAHDLRNIMQPISIFLNLSHNALLRSNFQLAQDYITEAINANQALRTDINAILDISELEFGIINLHYSSFDVRVLADEVLKENLPFANQRKVKLHLSKNHALPALVNSDRHHLKRILSNLVINAIKYTDSAKSEMAHVAIAIVSHAQAVRLDVIDNGIGIMKNEQENVFNPLYQLNNPHRDRNKGKGLGLSIVKTTLSLLSQHTIKLTSKPDIGTRFSLSLPKGDSIVRDESPLLADVDCTLSGIYVLLVENDALVKRSILALLHDNGADYEAVSSMDELRLLLPSLERDPDVVVCDYNLYNDCTANDIISALKAHFGYDLPILILTGETGDLSRELPGITIMHKPIEAKHLLMEINRLAQVLE